MTSDSRLQIRNFVLANMSALISGNLEDSDNIFELGFVTSIFAMQLLDFLEFTFGVTVPDDCITLANFSSVDRMAAMLRELDGDNVQ